MTVETLGQRLRRLRLGAGLSQRELAGPGVSYAYISRIEAGTRRPSVKALRELAPRVGVTVEYLETGENTLDDALRAMARAAARGLAETEPCVVEPLEEIRQRLEQLGYTVDHDPVLGVA